MRTSRSPGIKAVQTLSRLNRRIREKHDVFVLDFQNNAETITLGFVGSTTVTTIPQRGSRPEQAPRSSKLALDNGAGLFARTGGNAVVDLFPSRKCGARHARPHPRPLRSGLPRTAGRKRPGGFQGRSQGICARTYDFLASILPYTATAEWEKLSIRAESAHSETSATAEDEDLSRGILEAIDMDSYRVEKKAVMKISPTDDNAEIDPDTGPRAAATRHEAELDRFEQHPQGV